MRLFGRSRVRTPDLVTVIAGHQPGGTLDAEFIGEGSLPPDSGGYADMDALVSAVERTVLELYRSSPSETVTMGFQYVWYPWSEDKKALKIAGGPKEFLVFEIRQSIGGYEAWLPQDRSILAASIRLAELPSAISNLAFARWPALVGRTVPGMLHWNRELTAVGFRDLPIPGT